MVNDRVNAMVNVRVNQRAQTIFLLDKVGQLNCEVGIY